MVYTGARATAAELHAFGSVLSVVLATSSARGVAVRDGDSREEPDRIRAREGVAERIDPRREAELPFPSKASRSS